MKINLHPTAYSAKFKSLLESEAEYIVAFGGRGGGKTYHIELKLLLKSFDQNYCKIVYVNKVFKNIRDAQYSSLKKVAKNLGLYEYFRFYDGDYRIQNKVTGNWFIPKGMDDSENTKALDDPTIVWWDEITNGTQDDFFALNNLLRTPNAKLQFIASFNPVNDEHWIRHMFFDKFDKYAPNKELFDDIFVHHSTFQDNEFINRIQYAKKLKLQIVKGEASLECDYYGRWGNIKKDNLFIFNFNRERHTDENVSLTDTEYIEVSIDFNVEPMTAIVAQKDYYYRWLRFVKEYRIAPGDVFVLCEKIKQEFDTNRLIITGDSSGWGRSYMTRGHKTAYQIIKEELDLEDWQIKTPHGKPRGYIQEKRRLANYILGLHPDIKFGNLPYLFNDFESVETKEKGEMDKGKDKTKSHLIDAFCDYLFTFWREWDYDFTKGESQSETA